MFEIGLKNMKAGKLDVPYLTTYVITGSQSASKF
jgi:hypothetical protein